MALCLNLSKICWKQQKVNFLGFQPRVQRHMTLGQASSQRWISGGNKNLHFAPWSSV
jgi:hypothetical protein